ncbi:hypothetical protein AB1Y20_022437 [Prymnesium parvum]|uniref:Protein xylosyltransferase n=1 Tax=Prymnesium parvum TaxID=97485 RepID=A0AB34JJJ1_PRYPA
MAAQMKGRCPQPLPSRVPVILADNASRTVLMSAPKAGATQTTMLMLSMLNLTQDALQHDHWIHNYRREVFEKSRAHRRDHVCHDCGHSGQWTCVRFLRSPLDRIVSSYIHTMTYEKLVLPELGRVCQGCSQTASFAQFLMAISAFVNSSAMKGNRADDHVLPQTPLHGCDSEPSRLLSVPIEAMPNALLELEQLRMLHRAGAGVWPSEHYITQNLSLHASTANVSSWPWSRVKAAIDSKQLPPYDQFLTPEICGKLRCLFAADFSAWQRMCAQPELRQCRTCISACTAQLSRFQSCGCSTCGSGGVGASQRDDAGAPHRRFVIWMPHRTSSSWAIDLLMQHPNIVAIGEKYNDSPPSVVKSVLNGTDPFVAHLLRIKPAATTFGFQIKFNGSEESPLYAAFGSTPVICSFRRNLFDMAASYIISMRLEAEGCGFNARIGYSNMSQCTFTSSRPRIAVDPEALYAQVLNEQIVREHTLRNCQRRAAGYPTYFLWYEDLMDSPEQEYIRLEEFLGVPKVPMPKAKLVKIVSQPLDQIFANWDAIVRRFVGSPFECTLASSTQLSSARKVELTKRANCAATAGRRLSSADAAVAKAAGFDEKSSSSPAKQRCRELGLWARWLATSGRGYHGSSICDLLGVVGSQFCNQAFDEKACVKAGGQEAQVAVDAALDRLRAQHRASLWNGTCAFTISAWNNAPVVEVFLLSILKHNPELRCLKWVIADNALMNTPTVQHIRERFAMLQREWAAVSLHLVTMEEIQATMSYDFHELAFRYSVVEFNTAIKPHAFTHLFSTGLRAVLYFDPDCLFFSHLDEIAMLLHWRSFVMTPHETRPTPDDGLWQTDLQLMRAGIFNFGFLGLSTAIWSSAAHYLRWWADKLRFQGFVDLQNGMHFDQNWAVFITSFYARETYEVLVDPRYNVAYWNIHYRGAHILSDVDAEHPTYDGAPLVFFHFSGVATTQSLVNGTISPHQSRYTLNDFPQLQPLFAAYRVHILRRNGSKLRKMPYGFGRWDNGVFIPRLVRSEYARMFPITRQALALGAPSNSRLERLVDVQLNQFSAFQSSMWAWLFTYRDGVIADACATDITKTNMMTVFSNRLNSAKILERGHADSGPVSLMGWLLRIGAQIIAYLTDDDLADAQMRRAVLDSISSNTTCEVPSASAVPCSVDEGVRYGQDSLCCALRKRAKEVIGTTGSAQPPHVHVADAFRGCCHSQPFHDDHMGVNVVGYMDGFFGVATSARMHYLALSSQQGIQTVGLVLNSGTRGDARFLKGIKIVDRLHYGITLLMVNADETKRMVDSFVLGCPRSHYTIGYWAWELEEFPRKWRTSSLALDEIWVPSDFVRRSVRLSLTKIQWTKNIPVRTIPIGLELQDPEKVSRGNITLVAHALNIAAGAYVFLVVLGSDSVLERKGVDVALHAFKSAFAENIKVHLIIKRVGRKSDWLAGNGDLIQSMDAPNIHLLDRYLTDAEMNALQGLADCYVSLHRSEGFGLNILRNMLDGYKSYALGGCPSSCSEQAGQVG